MLSSLIYWLFQSVLFNFHRFMIFSNFLLLLIIDFIPLLLEKIFWIILILLNSLGLPPPSPVAQNMIYLKNVLCALKRNVYYVVVGWSVLKMSIRFHSCHILYLFVYLLYSFFCNYYCCIVSPSLLSVCVLYILKILLLHVYNYYLFLIN